ncbi:enoyl-CoA hydratase/isomerase family protein [Candidatus Entotheonella palauensis]|uniref:enoyl-CoA hydratase/isomerase family protein n=1 Tax=Candidatus Entotheonella palauensis TaxID=93172 RepID=UPI000B7FF432|nr:enoyl-CoA hydratase/isomerase family protein [Candidatus Entotheonella palauensis]
MGETDRVVLAGIRDGVGVMTLNRPEKFNCISTALMDGMETAMDRFERDPAVRAILLRAEGKAFCTGADLNEVLERRDAEALAPYISHIHRMLRRLEDSDLPIIAAVQGLCLAGGIEIMMACDIVFAGEAARIGDQHAQYGLVPGGGGSQRLPRLVGLRRALDLMFTARWLEPEEAHEWGLVNYVTEDAALYDRAMAYCRDLAQKSRAGLAYMKQISRHGLNGPLDNGLQLEENAAVIALLGADATEGLHAFQARRTPNFG